MSTDGVRFDGQVKLLCAFVGLGELQLVVLFDYQEFREITVHCFGLILKIVFSFWCLEFTNSVGFADAPLVKNNFWVEVIELLKISHRLIRWSY